MHHSSWGFFAHKRINRLAVLTLPPEMMVFFKKNIDYLADHAVDPDMRRYSTKQEGPRHFIDLDQYGTFPFDNLPRGWLEALAKHTDIWIVGVRGDTVMLVDSRDSMPAAKWKPYKNWFAHAVLPRFYDDNALLDTDSLFACFSKLNGMEERPAAAFYQEHLSEHGVLPWNLQRFQRNLTEAFRKRDGRRILRLSAEIGHYIGDAHVPLHTCSNYNGQKTNQHGIHGFWESRIPELFADETYDYLVGKPEYVERTDDWFWNHIFDSHTMVDSVLDIERQLRKTFPTDRQMCPDMRQGILGIHPCREFAAAYQDALDGMVERRMRAAIHAVGSAWYTAWVDAGQPDLSKMDTGPVSKEEQEEEKNMQKAYQQGKIIGRTEDH
ncbi:MAG: hypothetical protein JNJ57_14575 [Saprospiraceae bacterium]|nr:hypothetical protein [Saprospiraceae bacterium]